MCIIKVDPELPVVTGSIFVGCLSSKGDATVCGFYATRSAGLDQKSHIKLAKPMFPVITWVQIQLTLDRCGNIAAPARLIQGLQGVLFRLVCLTVYRVGAILQPHQPASGRPGYQETSLVKERRGRKTMKY
jgi:hypothetical protein